MFSKQNFISLFFYIFTSSKMYLLCILNIDINSRLFIFTILDVQKEKYKKRIEYVFLFLFI
jgi:hypothetical protein